jgi:hypothetical protein
MTSMMDRRAFIGTLAGGLLVAPLAAEVQQTARPPRVGYLGLGSPCIMCGFIKAPPGAGSLLDP